MTVNRSYIPVSIAAGFLALSCLPDAKAEPASNDLPEALRACIEESDDALRLACYDREIAELTPIEANVPAPGPGEAASSEDKQVAPVLSASQAPDVAQATERSEVEKFGTTPKYEKKGLMELTATVVEFSKGANSILTVSLDNGQVWRQKYSGKFRVQVGDQVTIKKGDFGGYTLIRKGRRITVRRVQ